MNFYQILWPWMKVTLENGFFKEHHRAIFHNFSPDSVWENAKFKIFNQPLWPWPTMKVTETGMVCKASQQSAFVQSFMTVLVIVFEKMSMFYILHFFCQLLWPWPWMKVTQTGCSKSHSRWPTNTLLVKTKRLRVHLCNGSYITLC